jgi:integrase
LDDKTASFLDFVLVDVFLTLLEIPTTWLPRGYPTAEAVFMPKITKRIVDAAPLPKKEEGDCFLWDIELKGFGLRIKPTGVKSYVLKYRVESRTRRLTIGKHGPLWTAEDARRQALALLYRVKDGCDPAAEKLEAREALTVGSLADLYLVEGMAEKPNKKPSSWVTDRSNIERHVKPLLGGKVAKLLTPADIAKFQADVAAGKSHADVKTGSRGRAIVKGGRGTAARSLAVLGAMLQFAVKRKLIVANPAKGVPLLKGKKKERFLSEAEVKRLAEAVSGMEAERKLSSTAAVAIGLLMLTGCRKSEILSLRWEWVDFERGCLRLPDSKTGAKVVPLGSSAMKLLSEVPRDDTYVLPGAKGAGHYIGLQKDWERVRLRAGLPGLRLHDLRHSFASFAVAEGNTLFMVGKVLGHKQARTTEIYAHLADDPLRAVADRTAARIVAAMKGSEREYSWRLQSSDIERGIDGRKRKSGTHADNLAIITRPPTGGVHADTGRGPRSRSTNRAGKRSEPDQNPDDHRASDVPVK